MVLPVVLGAACVPDEISINLPQPDWGSSADEEVAGGDACCDAAAPDVPPDVVEPGDVEHQDCSFPAPDGAPCNPYCQEGCASGEHCAITNKEFACLPADPEGSSHGGSCGSSSDCAPGLSCMQLAGQLPVCHQPCATPEQCPNGSCSLKVNVSADLSFMICQASVSVCDLFADDCPSGEHCIYEGAATRCEAPGALGAGAICDGDATDPCAEGLQCLVRCTEVCNLGVVEPSCSSCPNGSLTISQALGFGICVDEEVPATCDIFAQDCPPDEGCLYVVGGYACRSVGSEPAGSVCGAADDCEPGTLCVGGTCRLVCSTRPDADPAVRCSERCHAGHSQLTPQIWGIGVCQP